jgi:hypothetical protein
MMINAILLLIMRRGWIGDAAELAWLTFQKSTKLLEGCVQAFCLLEVADDKCKSIFSQGEDIDIAKHSYSHAFCG